MQRAALIAAALAGCGDREFPAAAVRIVAPHGPKSHALAKDPTNAYCRSDHYMYARYGIPVAFFVAAAWHVDYHMITDAPQSVDFQRTARIGSYIRDVVRAVADLPHRPDLTGPKPDPQALCRT